MSFPLALTGLIGRRSEIAAMSAALGGGDRLMALTGPGGIGKTRLAIAVCNEVSARFSDGVIFVPLAAMTDTERALLAILERVGIRAKEMTPLDALSFHLRDRRALLVLDDPARASSDPASGNSDDAVPGRSAITEGGAYSVRKGSTRSLGRPMIARPSRTSTGRCISSPCSASTSATCSAVATSSSVRP